MKQIDYKRLTISNIIWNLLERFGAQGVTFVVSIILARILDPSDYGVVSLITVFTSILSVFISGGLSTALIQKKDADDLDFSSMFYFNIFMCIVLYALIFLAAPLISDYYGIPELTALTRVSSLSLMISGVKGVQTTYVSKNLMYKKFFFATLGGTIGAAVIGIWMAYSGYGCWAIITQSLFNNFIDTIILWFSVKWRPKWMFSLKRLKSLLSFGWKVLSVVIIDRIYNNLRTLIIGKKYTSEDLAYYNKGSVFPNTLSDMISGSIDSVLFSVLSLEQDSKDTVKEMMKRSIKTSTYLMMPLMIGLCICAETIVKILLTEKWLPMVFFMRVFCITYALSPITAINLTTIKAMGRSDILLKIHVLKKTIGIVAIVISCLISVKAIAIGVLVMCILGLGIDTWPNRRLLNYGLKEQIIDIIPQAALSIVMGVLVYLLSFIKLNCFLLLAVQVIAGMCIYLFGSIALKIEGYTNLLGVLKSYLPKKTHNDNK